MRILIILFFFPFFVACQQSQEQPQTSAANIGSSALFASQQTQVNAPPSTTNIVFRSTDGGQTWQDVSAGLPKDLGVFNVSTLDNEVYLGTEGGLYHSSTTAATPVWGQEILPGERITDVFAGRNGRYAYGYLSGIFQEIGSTGVWVSKHNALNDKTIVDILETPEGAMIVCCDSGIFKSADGGATWKQVFVAETWVNSLVAAGDVLVCGSSKGVLRSTDGGEHWDLVLTEDGQAQKIVLIEGRLVAITRGGGTWQEVNEDPEGMAHRLRASSDGGQTWQRMDGSLLSARLINVMGDVPAPVWTINDIKQAGQYLFCSLDTGIFRSSDQGKTWELVLPANGKKSLNLTASGKVIYAVKVAGC